MRICSSSGGAGWICEGVGGGGGGRGSDGGGGEIVGGEEHRVASGICLYERVAGEGSDFRLWGGLDRGRNGREIELREAGAARGGGAAFATHGDEDGLGARGGDTRGAGIQETSYTADRDGCARTSVWIEQINRLRAEIGCDELRGVGCQ